MPRPRRALGLWATGGQARRQCAAREGDIERGRQEAGQESDIQFVSPGRRVAASGAC
jgi:hypothetical protein